MTALTIDCPTCHAVEVTVQRKNGILVAGCGCILSELQVRRRAGVSRHEVAEI